MPMATSGRVVKQQQEQEQEQEPRGHCFARRYPSALVKRHLRLTLNSQTRHDVLVSHIHEHSWGTWSGQLGKNCFSGQRRRRDGLLARSERDRERPRGGGTPRLRDTHFWYRVYLIWSLVRRIWKVAWPGSGIANFDVESNPKISIFDPGAWLTGPLPCSKISDFRGKAPFFEKSAPAAG